MRRYLVNTDSLSTFLGEFQILPGNCRGDEEQRVKSGRLELTAPLWGEGELHSRDVVRSLEEQVAADYTELIAGLAQFNLKQERRVIRLRPAHAETTWEDEATCVLRFELPKGAFATTVLRELVLMSIRQEWEGQHA